MSEPVIREPRTWQYGLSLFVGIMMVTLGVFQAIQGLAGLFANTVFVKSPDYVFAFNLTTWGWVHVVIGIVLIGTGFLIVMSKLVGRVLGITIVFVSGLANFASLPYYPLWSLILLALDVLIIWALATHDATPQKI